MNTILVDAWNTFVTEGGVNTAMHQLLETYPQKKIILTNANDEEMQTLGLVINKPINSLPKHPTTSFVKNSATKLRFALTISRYVSHSNLFFARIFYEICSGIDGLVNNLPYELFTLKHNPNKTDPAYYTTMLAQYGLPVDDVVYFEHNKEAVKSARSVGITTHHYDREKKDVQALKVFLDEQLQ